MGTGQLELRWLASSSASALRAAALRARGCDLADLELQQQLLEAASRLDAVVSSLPVPAELVWRHLLPLSAGIESNRELAEVVVRKASGPAAIATHAQRLADAIADVERVFRSRFPTAADDLVLRGRPLREQWEARGPGMLLDLATITDPELLVEHADVVLVQPVTGAGGEAYLAYNSVHFEAALANPIAALPEIMRLGWLLAQLHLDLPRFSERVTPARLPQIASLALVPAILRAAEYVELTAFSEQNLRGALQAWYSPRVAEDVTMTIWDWWSTYEESKPTFSIALQALERMLN